jgi:integrase
VVDRPLAAIGGRQCLWTLCERDLDPGRGSLLVRNGKGGRPREIGMDAWAWEQLRPRLATRVELPVGPLSCITDGPTRGRPCRACAYVSSSGGSPPKRASGADLRRTSCPRARRRARAREAVPLNVIQRQLGHANVGTTSITSKRSTPRRSSPRCTLASIRQQAHRGVP